MLRLQSIQVKLQKPLFSVKNRKSLRIQVGNTVKNTVNTAGIINQNAIGWSESITLPYVQKQPYLFQIYEKHQFGYNPQQLQTILKGQLIFTDSSNVRGTWDVFTTGQQKIGTISANILAKAADIYNNIKKSNSISSIQSPGHTNENKVWRITSMVARMINTNIKKGYFTIQVGQQIIRTQMIKSKAGELIYIEILQINLEHDNTQGFIKVYHNKGDKQQLGEAIISLANYKPQNKFTIMNQGQQVGQLYIESRIVDRSTLGTSGYNLKTVKRPLMANQISTQTIQQQANIDKYYKNPAPYNSIDFHKLDERFLNSQHRVLKQTQQAPPINPQMETIQLKKQDLLLNSSRVSRPSYLDVSMVSHRSKKKRGRNSVLHQNTNVFFPTQRRFTRYGDRENQRVTYLRERSLQYQPNRNGKVYQGASFGFGEKTDFSKAKKQSPGVGNYKLPSIWDRY